MAAVIVGWRCLAGAWLATGLNESGLLMGWSSGGGTAAATFSTVVVGEAVFITGCNATFLEASAIRGLSWVLAGVVTRAFSRGGFGVTTVLGDLLGLFLLVSLLFRCAT
ncbi:MAG: hypothetical protein FD130_2183 [Halothiobacillaceae bacterium]|nr:MAG: hypothetical protein FD130_2183 [Halothiobacillaceae bacterium]